MKKADFRAWLADEILMAEAVKLSMIRNDKGAWNEVYNEDELKVRIEAWDMVSLALQEALEKFDS